MLFIVSFFSDVFCYYGMISAIYKMANMIVDDCSVIVITTLCSHCYGLFQSLLPTVTKGTYNYDDDDYCHWFYC